IPIADADTRTLGRAFIFARAFTSARVVSIRLAPRSSFLCFDQRPSAMDAPARFTTASAPTPAPPNSPVAGFHATANPSVAPSPAPLCGRTNRQTVCPARASTPPSAVPTSPEEPVTRIFIFFLFSAASSEEKTPAPLTLRNPHLTVKRLKLSNPILLTNVLNPPLA